MSVHHERQHYAKSQPVITIHEKLDVYLAHLHANRELFPCWKED